MRHSFVFALLFAGLACSAAPVTAQTVLGRIVSEFEQTPVRGAQVELIDTAGAVQVQAVSDSAGGFRLRASAPGTYTLRATMLGYATTMSEPLRLETAGLVQVAVVLGTEAVALDPVRVVAQSSLRTGRLAEFYDRAERGARAGTGRILTRVDIETGGFGEMRHLLLVAPVRRGCPMSYFIDGMPASGNEMDGISLDQVEGVEIYSGPTSVPPEYQNRVSCAATLVWMRNDMPGRPFSWKRVIAAGAAVAASVWLGTQLMGR
jgi:hypothetical protein